MCEGTSLKLRRRIIPDDNKQVIITIRTRVTTGLGTEEVDTEGMISIGKATDDLKQRRIFVQTFFLNFRSHLPHSLPYDHPLRKSSASRRLRQRGREHEIIPRRVERTLLAALAQFRRILMTRKLDHQRILHRTHHVRIDIWVARDE